jgi:hypothetical protein
VAAATAAVAAPTETAAVASAAAEGAMSGVVAAGVQRPEAKEATGAAVTGAGAEAALGETELCFSIDYYFFFEQSNITDSCDKKILAYPHPEWTSYFFSFLFIPTQSGSWHQEPNNDDYAIF